MKRSENNDTVFTFATLMKYRNEIYGIAALWILAFHVCAQKGFFPIPFVPDILLMGNIGVDVFLFLSAIGLYFSCSKNDTKSYYIHRINRVIIPFLIITIPFFVWKDFFVLKNGIGQFLLDISSVNFWISPEYPVWYVSFILVAYAIFPLLYKAFLKNRTLFFVILTVLTIGLEIILYRSNAVFYTNCEKALSRIPIFLFGIFIAPNVKKALKLPIWCVIACLLAVIAGLFVFPVISLPIPIFCIRYLYGVIAVSLVVLWSFIRNKNLLKFLSFPLKWCGNISFEIYIVQVCIIRILLNYGAFALLPWWSCYIIMLVAVILVAFAANKIVSAVHKYLFKEI